MAATTDTLKKRIIQSKSFQEYVEQNGKSFEKRRHSCDLREKFSVCKD